MTTHPISSLLQYSVLAQVKTLAGIGYIPYALNEQGFVVQRRYLGIEKPHGASMLSDGKTKTLRECFTTAEGGILPIVNPAAVQAAGLEYAQVAHLAAQQGAHLLEHPAYNQLLLRWGRNPGGYMVFPAPDPEPTTVEQVAFTPYTDWSSGQTYYQLASDLPGNPALTAQLMQATGQVQRAQGVGGGQPGLYFTDRAELEQLVKAAGAAFALQQHHSLYTVTIYTEPGQYSHRWVFPVAEAARGLYCRLAGPSILADKGHGPYYPRLVWSTETFVKGQAIFSDTGIIEDCGLSAYQLARLPEEVAVEEVWSPDPICTKHLSCTDQPIGACPVKPA